MFLMLQSVIVYGLFAFVLWWLGTISARREEVHQKQGNELTFWTWDIVAALFIFAIISGIRWQVGVDHLSYLEGYQNLLRGLPFDRYGIEYGFEFISNIFASLGLHFIFFFAFWAFVQLFFIYYALRKERYLLPFIGIIIIWGPHYLSWMNGMRQMVAACMFVYSVQFIRDRKLIPYFITILLAATIHKAAAILLVFYFIPQKDYFKNKYVNLGLLITALVIGITPTWLQSVEIVEQGLAFLGYGWYSENLEMLVDRQEAMNFGPRRLSLFLTSVVNIWYAPKLKKVFKHTSYLVYFNFMFIGALLFNLFANTGHIFRRPISFFTIFSILTTSYLLRYLKPNKKYTSTLRFIVVFLIVITHMLIAIFAAYIGDGTDYANFKFFWNFY